MKSSSITLVFVISALALPQSAYANEENVPIDRNQAEVLLTEPATINATWSNFIGETNNPKQTAESISLVQDRGCQKINPLEFINNPEAFFKQCQKPTNTQSSQSTEPIEYLKVPKLDSGISVTVTQF
ncbi:hypothetical protein ACEYW6_21975 [Nostoc sp. UIC 10607]|uniref:Uncharacterized protein n=2 Tax=Nostoc TaxID=1177 RepID=A0ABR8IDF8_9NOSO|nr:MULTISPECIES: hypothetical protein [Nostoc]MBD2563026.1 hypothetical protein [Nostoc linckia FACHB-391]MBD2649168.1 hypothetical protein [Nostoc foliaceum FACHB-393]MBG1243541.1 hypothetical protein [Nostoc sp. NZL]